jgi:Tfp pilus assembly protein PilF
MVGAILFFRRFCQLVAKTLPFTTHNEMRAVRKEEGMRVQVAGVLAALQVMTTPVPVAGYNGKFPGKGNYRQWKKAATLYGRAVRAEQDGHKDQAMHLYELAIGVYPFDADFYLNLGLLYENDKRDVDAAEAMYKKGLELEPDDPELQLAWASLLCDKGEISESITVWRRAQTTLEERRKAEGLRHPEPPLRPAKQKSQI